MHPAALPRRAGHDGVDGLLEPGVGVGDDQLHPGQPAGLERAQERRPEGAILRVTDIQAEDLAAAVGRDPVAITTARLTTRPSTRALR